MKEQKGLQRVALDYYGDRYVEKESREDTEALFSIKADYLGCTSSELFNDENDLSYEELWGKIDYENTKQIPAIFGRMEVYSITGYSPEAYLLVKHTNGSIYLFYNTIIRIPISERYPFMAENKISEVNWYPDMAESDTYITFDISKRNVLNDFIKELYEADYDGAEDVTYENEKLNLLSFTSEDGLIAGFHLYSDEAIQDATTGQFISLSPETILNIKKELSNIKVSN